MTVSRFRIVGLALFAGLLLLSACGLETSAPDSTPTAVPVAVLQITPVGTPPITAQPTPLPPPAGVIFGPITGSDYTPEPLHTALPSTIAVQPCRVIIAAEQLALHTAPDAAAPVMGTAFAREKLVVTQVGVDGIGTQWVQTAAGWLPLMQNGVETARLDSLRACDILLGRTPDVTLLGLHVLNERSRDQVLQFVMQMASAGLPVGTVKGLNGTEHILTEIKQISPQTVTVYRSLLTPDGMGDCPADIRSLPDPVRTAQRWYQGLQPYWTQTNADYYEYMNECPAPLDWIAQFSIEMMRLAGENGQCLLLFSFPGGNPDMAAFDQLLPAYQYAVDHPCAPGRTHGVALHAYSLEDSRMVSESDKWVSMRHRILHERLQLALPAAANLPIYITELGIGGGTIMPPCSMIIEDALQYTYQVEEDPYVKGFHLWNVGSGAQWYDITPCLPDLASALLSYYGR